MPVKIRLQRKGRKKRPFYHIVIADSRAKRDGRYIQRIGSYNPMTKPATIELDRDAAFDWINKGAQPTDTVRAILRFKGILYRKHLMRGVAKGALTEEQANAKYQAWIDEKDAKVAARFEETAAELRAHRELVSGVAAPLPVVEEEVVAEEAAAEEAAEATIAEEAAVEEAAEATVAEEVVVEETVAEATEEVATAEADDLTKIEGIGPVIAKTLTEGGIDTFAKLADSKDEDVQAMIKEVKGNHNAGSWNEQAALARDDKWDELKALQDKLHGGVDKENA